MNTLTRSPIRCVALDFDLTMFDYSRPHDTRVLVPWFQRLHDAGVMVGIASGRTLENLNAELRGIDISWREPFPQFVIHEEFYIHWPDAPEPEEVRQWNQACALSVKELCREIRPYFDSCAAQMDALGIGIEYAVAETNGGVTLVLENPAGAERARLLLEQMIPSAARARISRNHHILLATPAEYHKGSALDRLRVLGGLEPRDVLAIGDNLNDLAMIDESLGFRCATVLNADPMVQNAVAGRRGLQATRPIAFGIAELFDSIFDELAASGV
ncbi:hypothetical protein BH09VER1_BH09VER1_55690 [soil metagenome]